MIHISKLFELVQLHKEFSIVWIKESGDRVVVQRATCTSFHSSGRTMNVKLLDNNEFRKVNRNTVVEFNGQEVTL